MDIVTHTLASLALARGVLPRQRGPAVAGMVCAGTLADVDLLSSLFGPPAYFAARLTFTHSLPGLLVVVSASFLIARFLGKKQAPALSTVIVPITAAGLLHLALDLCQSEGVALLWPLRPTRFAMDWLPSLDLWILAILAAGVCLPEFFRLITSEIGVRDKRPQGQRGALIALALLAALVGTRAFFHTGAVASLEPHLYGGESARRAAAFPDKLSIFTWHGVVETESLVCQVDVPEGLGSKFDPENADCLHKPEASPQLTAAQNTEVVQAFVRVEPFARATVAKSQDGYEVAVRSMRDIVERATPHRVAALILLDAQFKVLKEKFVWAQDIHAR